MTAPAEKIVPLRRAGMGHGGSDTDPPTSDDLPDNCPIEPIGYHDGSFYFLSASGEIRKLTARALGSEADMAGLFMGRTDWLEANYPRQRIRMVQVGGESQPVVEEAGYSVKRASAALMRACQAAGHFGTHIAVRKSGIWRGADGAPVVHVGTRIRIAGAWYRAGRRVKDVLWVTGPQCPEPGTACDTGPGQFLVDGLRNTWSWQSHGGPIVVAGLIAAAYYGGAADWRPSGFISGGAQTGKSMLLEAIAACLPMHEFSNDTSAAGITGVLNGHAMPVIIDEASDRDPEGARKLMDIVLASTGGQGVRGLRGTADGGVRSMSLLASFIYGSTAPPPLGPTHLGRITLVELAPAPPGAYGRDAMQAFTEQVRDDGPALWARALDRYADWRASMAAFATGLRKAGCAPREIDQASAILAGHHVLTEDGVATDRHVRAGIAAIRDFVRTAEDVRDDDNPRRVAEHLLMQRIQYDGSTRQETIGNLLERAYDVTESATDTGHATANTAIEVLGRYGIRPIRAWDKKTIHGRPIPRLGDGEAIWMLPVGLQSLFRGTPWEIGKRWEVELLRLTGARRSKKTVRIGGGDGKAIWVPRSSLQREEPIPAIEMAQRLGLTFGQLAGLVDRYAQDFPIADRDAPTLDGWLFDPDHVTGFLERQANIDSG